ncbi:hypothetical protein ABZ883_26395 [Streptomyces sp. NPDC046977]|uniref:hypothetical protein n=1 Tax=Streptomyces sp. NPDC046977 TaxID=3154703 RepID=UPI0033D17270
MVTMALDHNAKLMRQTESTPAGGFVTGAGKRWTGQVILVCNCGYASGWTDPAEIRDDIYTHMTEPDLRTLPFRS